MKLSSKLKKKYLVMLRIKVNYVNQTSAVYQGVFLDTGTAPELTK